MPALVRRIVAGQKVVTRRIKKPSVKVGDRIWLREPWKTEACLDGYSGSEIVESYHEIVEDLSGAHPGPPVLYLADESRRDWWGEPGRYRQARFLPRALARPWRGEVVSVEWVPAPPEGIDDDEAIREGTCAVTDAPLPWMPWTLDGQRWAATPRAAFLAGWNALHDDAVTCWRIEWREVAR